MHPVSFLIISLLLSQSSCQDSNVSPRRSNIISQFLDKALDSLFDELSKNNLTILAIDLGENVGRITNIEANVSELRKRVDGYKSFGLTLDTNVTKIMIGGSYDIKNLDIPQLFPVYGKGNFSVAVEGINLNLWLNAMQDFSTGKFNISILNFNILIQKSTVKFDNFMNDPSVTDFLNELISNIIPRLAKMITQPAKEYLQGFFNYFGNGIFDCIKKESTMEKIQECIINLFLTDSDALCPLTKKILKFFSELSVDLIEKLASKS